MQNLLFLIAQIYSRVYGFLHDRFHINIRGLGFLLRKIKKHHIIQIPDNKFILLHQDVSTSYSRLIGSQFSEIETHIFLRKLFDSQNESIVFIDIGANVGEMIVDFGDHPMLEKAYAFDLFQTYTEIIETNCFLNNLKKVSVVNKALSDKSGTAYTQRNPTPQAFISKHKTSAEDLEIEVSTLDSYFEREISKEVFKNKLVVMLVDVEGHELNVIQGAESFICEFKPIIIFEYHKETKFFFTIDNVKNLIGNTYCIFRLNRKGYLDNDVEDAWNCVAVPNSTQFEELLT